MFYIMFYRKHVENGSVLTDNPYCWTFNDFDYFSSEVDRLKGLDHIKVVAFGTALRKKPQPIVTG